jgi:hypothetical protein
MTGTPSCCDFWNATIAACASAHERPKKCLRLPLPRLTLAIQRPSLRWLIEPSPLAFRRATAASFRVSSFTRTLRCRFRFAKEVEQGLVCDTHGSVPEPQRAQLTTRYETADGSPM